MDTFDLLRTLTETPGPSGFEADVAAIIQEIWEPLVDEIHVDRVGSLIGIKHGRGEMPNGQKRPRILLAAHMDEIGLMVSKVIEFKGYGYLRMTNLGGIDIRQLFNQRVTVHGKRNLPGLLGSIPGRMRAKVKHGKPFDYDTLVVDTGLSYDELKTLVDVGDAISFHQPLRQLKRTHVTGKSLDNRCSVTAVTLALEYLQARLHLWDVVAVATAQEETRLLGAATSAFTYRPDIAIAIDVTFGNGPGTSDPGTFELGGGPVLGWMPDTHQGVTKGLAETAGKLEMNTQNEYRPRGGGTDAYYMQIAREGVPTSVVGIALRYMHTVVESINTKDVERVGRLLGEYITTLNADTIGNLAKTMMEE
jgi:endoglucanase